MSLRPPDWYQRLRELERRADNLTTDVSRLWQMAPQMPEWPGYAMPVIIPDATTPPPTTTTTTTSTTTTTTTTTSTTTTVPPLSCWPDAVPWVEAFLSGVSTCSFADDFNGSWRMHPQLCGGSGVNFYFAYKADAYSAPDMKPSSARVVITGGYSGVNSRLVITWSPQTPMCIVSYQLQITPFPGASADRVGLFNYLRQYHGISALAIPRIGSSGSCGCLWPDQMNLQFSQQSL